MLPAASSVDQAEQLLAIAAANPDGDSAGAARPPADQQFLVDARRAAQARRSRKATLRRWPTSASTACAKDALGNDGLVQSHVQQLWRINTVQGAKSFASHPLMYAAMSERLCLLRARVLQPGGGEAAGPDLSRPARGGSQRVDVLRLAHPRSSFSAAVSPATWLRSTTSCCPPPQSIPGRDTTRTWICSATPGHPAAPPCTGRALRHAVVCRRARYRPGCHPHAGR